MAALGLSYMGTKLALAPDIAEIISAAKSGPVLDGFAGMCAVGQVVARKRQVWSNDVQIFAATVARLLFVYPDHPPRCSAVAALTYDEFQYNREILRRRFHATLEREQAAIESRSTTRLLTSGRECRKLLTLHSPELSALRRAPRSSPYRLFSLYYSGSYFSLAQCIDIDSIVFALNRAAALRRLSRGQRAWLVVTLARILQKISTTTGHFAQYLEPKPETLSRFVRQRSRSVWEEWISAIPLDGPVGDWDWRASNRVFRDDTLRLLGRLAKYDERPGVIYADPPYTEDHYSRYYHLLETLIKYDYPVVEGKARYRTDRFHTPFSIKTKATAAFETLAKRTANLKADLVLSYPTTGVLSEIGTTPYQIIRHHFRSVDVCRRISHDHSTLGASKGPASHAVTETIYWARP